MVSSLYKLDFKKHVIPHTLALVSKLDKLLPLRYLLLKHVHSSAKLPALQMTYWINNVLFLYFRFIIFSIMTLSTSSYILKCQSNVRFLVISDYFHKISIRILIENIQITGQKD